MRAKRDFRDREDVQVAVLDALVDRGEEGMTVFELRAAVDVDIDTLEAALAALKEDSLISVDADGDGGRVVILPADRVVPDPDPDADRADDPSLIEALRQRFGL